MSLPQEFENAAKAELKLYRITEEERTQLITNPRFAKAAYLAQELCHSQDELRPDLDHLAVDGELDLETADTSQVDEWNIEGYRDFMVAMKSAEESAHRIAQAVLGREIERDTVIDLLKQRVGEVEEGKL
jgi:hypothetical protein